LDLRGTIPACHRPWCKILCFPATAIPAWLILPFGLLLLLIAVMPLSPVRIKTFWEHNYARIAGALAAFVAIYYLVAVPAAIRASFTASTNIFRSWLSSVRSLWWREESTWPVKGEATPIANVVFLFVGALLANVIGTTGASMVLIRPFIRMNKIRASPHHIVFFIFLVRT